MIENNKDSQYALKPIKNKEKPQKNIVSKAIFIINATKAAREEYEEANEYAVQALSETIELLRHGNAFEFTPIGIMNQREQAFGPFKTKKLASYMIPSILDSQGKDWKGHVWTFGTLPMIWEEYLEPNYQVPRVYWCKKCGHSQAFKGSCGHCRSQGDKYIPTIEIKDWEGEL